MYIIYVCISICTFRYIFVLFFRRLFPYVVFVFPKEFKPPTCWLFHHFQLLCQLWSKQFPFPSFSRRWAAQAAVCYLPLWHTSEHVSAPRWLLVISVMWTSCSGCGFTKVLTFPWSHRCAADWLPTHEGTKKLFLTFLQPKSPLDSPNTFERIQTANLLLPSQLPVSISICRT